MSSPATPRACAQHGLHPQTKILDIGYVTADEQLAALLDIRPGGRLLRIHRLRLADGEPMSIDTSHLPARRFPGLRRQLERHASLYETLRTGYGIQLAEAEETIETVLADPHDARLLDVDPGIPLLLLSRHAIDPPASRSSGRSPGTGATGTSSSPGYAGTRSSAGPHRSRPSPARCPMG